jgi:hypothetical protein
MRNYAGVIHKDKDTAYGVHFPDLVGCFAGGDTEEEGVRQCIAEGGMLVADLTAARPGNWRSA